MKSMSRIKLKRPELFEDPFRLDYNRYIKVQHEKVLLYEAHTGQHRNPDNDERLDPEFKKLAAPLAVASYMGEYAASVYSTTAAATAQTRAFRECCLFQAVDELRHAQMDRGRILDFGITDDDEILRIWNSDGLAVIRDAFKYLTDLEDAFQIIFCANYIIEGAGAASYFPNVAELAAANGDHITYVIDKTRFTDEVRHIGYARAMVKALIEDDDNNLAILQEWADEFFAVAGPGILQLFGYNDLAPVPYKSSGEWLVDGLAHYAEHAEKVGIKPPDIEEMISDDWGEVQVSLEALNRPRRDGSEPYSPIPGHVEESEARLLIAAQG